MASGKALPGPTNESPVPEHPSSPKPSSSCSPDPNETSQCLSKDPAAPPPPPLPPPPLPQALNTPVPSHGLRRKRRVRSFYWKPIPEEKVRGKPNIWTLCVRQQHYEIDVRSIEEMFGQQEEAQTQNINRNARLEAHRRSQKETKDEISILDSKRGMNLGIFLKQFKKSNQALVEDVRLGNSRQFGLELLKELLKLLPEEEEIKALKEFKGDLAKLTTVDSFMFLLIQVPCFEVRIEAMILQEEFFPSYSAMSRDLNVVLSATKELLTCEELHAILHLVLQAGNIMNQGGYAGNAVGFKLSSLLSLADTKANKPGINLLHFVALEAQKKDENLLKFPEKLMHVQSAASRISFENIETEISSLSVRMQAMEEKIQDDAELLLQLNSFLQSSAQTLQDLEQCRLNLRRQGNMLIDFFCEDKDTFKLDECFRIFQDFCLKFQKAVKDNLDRELKEAARQQRCRELEKRRIAWASASGDQSSGANFGRSSSENDVNVLTKEGLVDFLLHPRTHSPLGRSASDRRYRHTKPEHNLHDYLELFPGSTTADITRFSSLPRSGRPNQRKTIAWISSAYDNRELGPQNQVHHDKMATSSEAQTEPVRPLSRYFMSDYAREIGPNSNNNSADSESIHFSQVGQNCRKNPLDVGNVNVSGEKETQLNPNNSSATLLDNRGNVSVTDVEKKNITETTFLDTPKSSAGSEEVPRSVAVCDTKIIYPQREREEESNTVSSTTCDTPLPADSSMSNKKAISYIIDCTEADCSVMFEFSELESTPLPNEGEVDLKSPNSSLQFQDPSSLSSDFESLSTNDPSVSVSADEGKPASECPVMPSVSTNEVDGDSTDMAEGRQVVEKGMQISSSKLKSNTASKLAAARTGRPARALTLSDTRHLRKVVPISKASHSGSNPKRVEKSHENTEAKRLLRDQSILARKLDRSRTPARHFSLPPEAKAERGTSTSLAGPRDPLNRPSVKKPNAKPVRNVPKPLVEEKMCRSTMRALAQAQAASANAPQTSTHGQKSGSPVPSFARNTVAFSSRSRKDTASQPGTPLQNLSRSSSLKAPSRSKANSMSSGHSVQSEDKPARSLQRVHSVRGAGKQSGTSPAKNLQETSHRESSSSEKSLLIKDSSIERTLKPIWK